MFILQIIFTVLSLISLAGIIGAVLYWKKAREDEDEERIMYGKRATLGALLVFLVCGGVVIALWFVKPDQPVSPPGDQGVNAGKPSLGLGQANGTFEGIPLNPALPQTLSTSVIDYHYPLRGQEQVPLNTLIVVHKAPSLAEGEGEIRLSLYGRGTPDQGRGGEGVLVPLDQVPTTGNPATIVFRPHEPLKSSTAYSVSVQGYSWDFTTGTISDNTLPEVVNQEPDTKNPLPRNSVVEFTFSEPVLIVAYDAIAVGEINMPPVQAQARSAPPYKAIDVIGKEVCGQNTCKQQIYCFGGGATLRIALKDQKIMDFAGNYLSSLSLQGRGQAIRLREPQARGVEGIPTFSIGDKVSTGTPPTVIRTIPLDLATAVDIKAPLEVWFSGVVAKSTLTPKAVTLNHPEVNTWLSSFDTVDTAATTADARSVQPSATKVFLWHDPFNTKTIYYATVAPSVQDLLQNCITPSP